MALKDNASLALIPAAYKQSKVYSVLPTNGNGDFDFTRSGNATRVNKGGYIETVGSNIPRLDYPLLDGVVQDCPALLLEPSRTNLLSYSEDFSQSTQWLISSMTVTTDDAVAPNGSQTADKIQATGAGSIRTNNSYTVTSGYSFSIFVKKGNSRYVTLRSFAFTTSAIIGFDLDTETAQTGGVIEKYPNDWYRLSISKDVSSDADKNGFFYIYLPNSLGSTATVSGNYAYFWGAQLEDADYLTSYIPNLSTGTTTRNAETCNGAGDSSTFNDSEGVLFAEISALADDLTFRQITINDSSASDLILIGYRTNSNRIYSQIVSNGVSQVFFSFDVSDITESHKVAVKYSLNSVHLWIDGVKRASDLSATMPTGLNVLDFRSATGSAQFYGKVKQLMVFNTALSDSELEELTS